MKALTGKASNSIETPGAHALLTPGQKTLLFFACAVVLDFVIKLAGG